MGVLVLAWRGPMMDAGTKRQEAERLGQLLAPGAVFAVGATYTLTAAKGVIGGDSGELVAVAASGGVAHPPGYPLYLTWLRLFGWLPAQSPAHRAALATVILATLSVWALVWALGQWKVRPSVGALVAAVYAFSPLAWRLGTEPEVFALNVALAMFVLGLCSPEKSPRPFVLGLVAGLGLSNHHSIVLLAPIGLWGVLRSGPSGVARAAGGLLLGLLPYVLLLMAVKGSACSWAEPSTPSDVVRHFLRADYGTTQLASGSTPADPSGQLALLGKSVGVELAALSMLGFFAFLGRKRRLPLGLLVATFLLAGPVFVSRFNLPPSGGFTSILVRFHLLPTALACFLAGLGLEQIVARDPARRERLIVAFVFPLGFVRGALSFPDIKARHDNTLDAWVANVVLTVPPGSIVATASDDTTSAMLYARCALAHDVVPLAPGLLFAEWYAAKKSREIGLSLPRAQNGVLDPVALTSQLATKADRPLFLEALLDPDPRATIPPHYPLGPLLRVVGRTSEIPDDDVLYAQNVALSEKLKPDAGRKTYARPWLVLANHFAAKEDPRAEDCRARYRANTVASGSSGK